MRASWSVNPYLKYHIGTLIQSFFVYLPWNFWSWWFTLGFIVLKNANCRWICVNLRKFQNFRNSKINVIPAYYKDVRHPSARLKRFWIKYSRSSQVRSLLSCLRVWSTIWNGVFRENRLFAISRLNWGMFVIRINELYYSVISGPEYRLVQK